MGLGEVLSDGADGRVDDLAPDQVDSDDRCVLKGKLEEVGSQRHVHAVVVHSEMEQVQDALDLLLLIG